MTRILLERTEICRVCHTRFVINNAGFDPTAPDFKAKMKRPIECPCCTAPVRLALPDRNNAAITIVLTYSGVSYYRREFHSVARFLTDHSLNTADVDDFVRRVEQLDLAAAEQSIAADDQNDPGVREELKAIQRASRERDTMLTEIRAIAAEVKRELLAERERCLAIYRERCGVGKTVPLVVYRYR
jgi:hypothetical protein